MAHFMEMHVTGGGASAHVNVERISYMSESVGNPGRTTIYFDNEQTLSVEMDAHLIAERVNKVALFDPSNAA